MSSPTEEPYLSGIAPDAFYINYSDTISDNGVLINVKIRSQQGSLFQNVGFLAESLFEVRTVDGARVGDYVSLHAAAGAKE